MKSIRVLISVALSVMMIVCVSACQTAETALSSEAAKTDAPASLDPGTPEESGTENEAVVFNTTDLRHNPVTESILQGYKLTILNIWGTYCGPCIQEMPGLGAIAKEYRDRGVQVIGIVADAGNINDRIYSDVIETAQSIILQTGADYLHVLPSKTLYDLYIKYASVIPLTFFLDENGNILGQYLGARNEAAWKVLIDEALEGGSGQ